jgi:hypothetical protein
MASVLNRASQTKWLVSCAHRSVAETTARRIRTPPMVGVPAFFRWLWGPSSLTTCRARISESFRMMGAPRIMDTTRAVRNAPAVRKVTYRKTLNGPKIVCNGNSR